MKKVLVVITTAFVTYGGLTNSFMNYYRKFEKNKILIDIASMNDCEEDLLREIENNNGKYFKLPDKRKVPLKYLIAFFKLCKDYDVVHVNGNSATIGPELFLAKIRGIPVRIAHNHTSRCTHKVLNFLCYPLLKFSMTHAIAVSKKAGWVYRNQNFFVLNNAIDLERFAYSDVSRKIIREKYEISNDNVVFGHIGKLVFCKNHTFLLKVFTEINKKILNNSKLLLVGDGVLRKDIEKEIDNFDIKNNVIIAGMQKDTSPFYSAMDLFLFPSLFEGSPLALYEAQASGLYSIAAYGNVPIEANAGELVTFLPLDINLWKEKIQKFDFYRLRNERRLKSENARYIMAKNGYDNGLNAKNLLSIYLSNYEAKCNV